MISLNWDYGYFTLTDFNSHATVKNISTGKTEYFDFITTPHTAQNGGIGWYTKLRSPDISPKIQSNPAGYAIAYFEPSRPLRNNDNLVKDFDVIYVHDKCPGKTLIDVSDIIYFKMEEEYMILNLEKRVKELIWEAPSGWGKIISHGSIIMDSSLK